MNRGICANACSQIKGFLDYTIKLVISGILLDVLIFHIVWGFFVFCWGNIKMCSKKACCKVHKGIMKCHQQGRLILIAIDETSLKCIDWTVTQVINPELDFIHLLHVDEFHNIKGNLRFDKKNYHRIAVNRTKSF